MGNKYILDANIFIEAKNRHYKFEFCDGFWSWIIEAHDAEILYSTKTVLDELKIYDDNLTDWVVNELPPNFFLEDKDDVDVMVKYAQLMDWAVKNESRCLPKAIADFQAPTCADSFIIACAAQNGYTIVTQESQKSPECKRRIIIPNAAAVFNVECINIYELLSTHASGTFNLKK